MRSVVITGCSSGFGLDIAPTLARRGWRTFATMRNLDKRARLDDALRAAGGDSTVLQLDVTDQESIDRAVKELLSSTGGTLDAVVHNAGISGGGAFEELSDEEIRSVFETNFFGVLALTRAVLPTMRAQRSGRVLLISSASAFRGTPAQSHYCASKFAIEGWAESISMELKMFNIDVSCVEPGPYRTDIWESSPRTIADDSPYKPLAEPFERFLEEKWLPRARHPQEVADVVTRALEAKRPRFRYPVGPQAKLGAFARGVVPHRAFEAATRKIVGI